MKLINLLKRKNNNDKKILAICNDQHLSNK